MPARAIHPQYLNHFGAMIDHGVPSPTRQNVLTEEEKEVGEKKSEIRQESRKTLERWLDCVKRSSVPVMKHPSRFSWDRQNPPLVSGLGSGLGTWVSDLPAG